MIGRAYFRGRLKILLFLFLGLSVSLTVQANDESFTKDMSLQSLIMLGLSRNLDLQAVKINTLQAGEEVVAQDARFDPKLFAELSHGSARTPVAELSFPASVDSDLSRAEVGVQKGFKSGLTSTLSLATERDESNVNTVLDPSYRSHLLLSVRQPLLRNFGSAINMTEIEIAKQRLTQTQYQYLRQAQTLAQQIEIVYFELIRARAEEMLRAESRQLVAELLDANRARLEAGFIPVTEVQETETALADRDLRLALATQEREQIALELNNLLRNSYGDPRQLSEGVHQDVLIRPEQIPDMTQLLDRALASRPDLQALKIERTTSSLQRKYLDNQVRPELDFVVSAGFNDLSGEERVGTSSVHDGPYVEAFEGLASGDGYQWTAGLTFSYPLGNRAAEAKVAQSRYEERRADYRRQELELLIETELNQRLNDLTRSAERFEISERLQALAVTTLKQEQARLDEGLSDTFRVLIYQGNMIDAKIDRLTALVEYNKSLTRFNLAMGSNLEKHGIRVQFNEKEMSFEKM